ncbi:DEAD/DEAH box helicase [Metallosphaera tengchongensis]|uniref:DEAD/DEAH box helicase n=1 Tax=Metallosphaera tengchongensis TaxID=1532350 RepID=A0A6N0NW63_9CREN|nr:DEAD/DEAH box helicase [Metallosphaera tengchongensis]QKQ99389.1 DEAD/DEAH box helicase [Metallosphaera tengchongensis]
MTEGLNHKISSLMKERNWKKVTQIQEMSMGPILKGHNTLIIAPTGFGKTEAAILPILSLMTESEHKPVSMIYITPLKALINDITIRIDWWASKLGLSVSRKHGEVPQKEKNLRLKKAPHILVTTPEGLEIDMDWASKFRENYKNVNWIVVDEIHELISSKRGAQLFVLLERLKHFSGRDFQRVGLSATIRDEKFVASSLFGSSCRPISIVKSNMGKEFKLRIREVRNSGNLWQESAKTIRDSLEPPSLIFTNSRFLTERLHEELERLGENGIFVHHSSISRDSKTNTEEHLRAGKAKAVICTKTLELGIDIGQVKKIVMYRPPPSVASFLQRLGRSGHCVGGVPQGEIICTQSFDCLEALAIYSLSKRGVLEKPKRMRPLDVVAREIVGMALQYSSISLDTVYSIITSSFVYKDLSRREFLDLIEYLKKNNLIVIEGDQIKLGKSFFKIWTFNKNNNFVWAKSFSEFFSLITNDETFRLKSGDRSIGEIDALYVYKHIRPGDMIRISGKLWKVARIHNGSLTIDLLPADKGEGEIPIWRGDSVPKSSLIPKEMERIFRDSDLLKSEILNEEVKRDLETILRKYEENGLPIPSSRIIYVTLTDKEIVYSSIMDEKVANTLAHVLMYMATTKYTLNVYSRASIYGFSIGFTERDLFSDLISMNEKKIRKLIIKSIFRSPLFMSVEKEIQASFGKIGKVNPKEDKLIVREALRQTVRKYFNVKGTLKFIGLLKAKKIEIVRTQELNPLAEALLSHAPIRPWMSGVNLLIYETLKEGAYSLKELSEMLSIPPKSLEVKLKQMRKTESKYRVTSFIDVDNKEMRWCLAEELKSLVNSDEFFTSFSSINKDETFIAEMKSADGSSSTELIFKPGQIEENPDDFIKRIPMEEIGELRVVDPVDPVICNMSPRYYFVKRSVVPYLLLNASAYIQNLKYT